MNSVLLISTLVFVLSLTILGIRLIFAKKWQKVASGKEKKRSAVLKSGKWQDHHEGVDYSWQYHRGSKNSPSYLDIVVAARSPGSFKITKENAFDRFFKKRGICCEITTHDTAFDDKFYITSNTVNFTGLFFGNTQKRKLVNEIYDKGFKEISHDGKVLRAKWTPFRPGKNFDMRLIGEIALLLSLLGKDMPLAPTPLAFDNSSWKKKRAIAFAVPILLEIVAIASLVTGLIHYNPLDEGKLILSTLKISIPLLIFFLWAAVQLLKGRSSSHRELIVVFFLSLFGFILTGAGLGIFLNGYLDRSPAVDHETLIVGKYISRSDKSASYHARVASWRKEGERESLRIGSNEYYRVFPNKTELTVTTKAGKFNYEWLVKYKIYGK
jgi:hypothetical protein